MTNYRAGARKEYAVLRSLKSRGAVCSRSAGSHGLWDVVSVLGGEVTLIQVKSGRRHEDANLALFRALKVRATKELWHYTRGSTKPRVEEL